MFSEFWDLNSISSFNYTSLEHCPLNIQTYLHWLIWLQMNGAVGSIRQPRTKPNPIWEWVVAFGRSADWASRRMPAAQMDRLCVPTVRVCVPTVRVVGSGEWLPYSFLNQLENQMPRSKAQPGVLGERVVFRADSLMSMGDTCFCWLASYPQATAHMERQRRTQIWLYSHENMDWNGIELFCIGLPELIINTETL